MQPPPPVLRVARPTDDLEALLPFYVDGLGLEILYRFAGHGDFEGVMIGHPGQPYHLEFTRHLRHRAGRAPTEDNLLVFYLPVAAEYAAALARMRAAGFAPVRSFNPFWDDGGTTFADPDGYRVVLFNRAWSR
jgi:catechol 2,3-dioxygenase-like lactoylglutathione lyase family enzyme